MKQFLVIFNTGMIGELDNTANNNSTQNGTRISQSFALTSVARKPALSRVSRRHVVEGGMQSRPIDDGDVGDEITADKRSSLGSEGSGRAIIKKTRQWEVSYD